MNNFLFEYNFIKPYFEMNQDRQDLLHQVKYSKVRYTQVQYIQRLDDYKHDDKIYEIYFKKKNNLNFCSNLKYEFYLLVCLNKNKDEYGGIGLTFSTMFNSDKRRGLKENNDSHGI
jgi:hypothetical protein